MSWNPEGWRPDGWQPTGWQPGDDEDSAKKRKAASKGKGSRIVIVEVNGQEIYTSNLTEAMQLASQLPAPDAPPPPKPPAPPSERPRSEIKLAPSSKPAVMLPRVSGLRFMA